MQEKKDVTKSDSEVHPWAEFELNSREQWVAAARLELNGADPFEKLTFHKGKTNIRPYYDRKDAGDQHLFSLSSSKNSFLGAKSWINAPKVVVHETGQANEQALEHLRNGADGILFEITHAETRVEPLLLDIQLHHCSVFFQGTVSSALARDFAAYCKDNFDQDQITGGIFSNPGRHAPLLGEHFQDWAQFHPLGLIVAHKKTGEETLAQAIFEAVSVIDQLTDRGHRVESVFNQISFSIRTEQDFFYEIAKLKALRILWTAVSKSYHLPDMELQIHSLCQSWIRESLQPHSNMLNSTISALAATLGGCDALTLEPEDPKDSTQRRIARNVSLILREESQLSKVADPVAGAYYLESVTRELVKSAWENFQKTIVP